MQPFIEAAQLPDDAIEVACVVDAWGVKGWFKVLPFSADPQALFSSKRWFLLPSERGEPGFIGPSLIKIQQAKNHSDFVVAKAHDCADRDAAQTLKGARVFISRQSFPTPQDDEFYWVDLVGLKVLNREGLWLGQVSEIMSSGAQSVLVLDVSPEYEQRLEESQIGVKKNRPTASPKALAQNCLIPFVSQFIDQVDLKQGLILVDWQVDY
jgi:16S rRNA processing protein RimM